MSSDVESNGAETEKENTGSDSPESGKPGIVKITTRPAQAAIGLHQPLGASLSGPIMSSDIEVAEVISDAGLRPIAVSHLEIAGSYMNGRPIGASHLAVVETLPGNRPIFASLVKMVEGEVFYGDRPVMVSDPSLMKSSLLPGGRPIASNNTDDSDTMMGYID